MSWLAEIGKYLGTEGVKVGVEVRNGQQPSGSCNTTVWLFRAFEKQAPYDGRSRSARNQIHLHRCPGLVQEKFDWGSKSFLRIGELVKLGADVLKGPYSAENLAS